MSVSLDNIFSIDPEQEVDKICTKIREVMRTQLKKRGLVVGISGGVDSGVCAALCVEALGKNKVFGLLMPEQDSSSASVSLGEELVEHLGIEYMTEDIAPTLEAIGCYRWRDDAIRSVFRITMVPGKTR